MKTMLPAVLLGLMLLPALPGMLQAQGEIPPQQSMPDLPKFFVDVLNFASDQPGKTRLDVYIEVPYEVLRFTKEGDAFRAAYEATIQIRDSAENLAEEKWWTERVETGDYNLTSSPSASKLSERSFHLIPGIYEVTVLMKDEESGKTASTKRRAVVKPIPPDAFTLSDVMVVNHVGEDSGKKVLFPNISGNVGHLAEGFYLFFEAYNGSRADSAWMTVAIRSMKGDIVKSDSFLQVLEVPRTSCFHRESTATLIAGDYIMEVRAAPYRGGERIPVPGSGAIVSRQLAIYWRGLPTTIADIDLAIDQLQYITEKELIDAMKEAPREKKAELFQEFWKKRDPTPSSDRNELMEEYFARVAYANKHFSHYIEGWKTDMGMVYIIFGPPSSIDRHPFDIDTKPYEVWTYFELNRQFVFIDLTGFGDYRLQTPIWDLYRTRPR